VVSTTDPYGRNLGFLDRYIIVTHQYKVCFVDTEESMAAIMHTQLHATVRKSLCLKKQIYCIALTCFISENFHIFPLKPSKWLLTKFLHLSKKKEIINHDIYVNNISYIYLTTLNRNSCLYCLSVPYEGIKNDSYSSESYFEEFPMKL
jgi:hypothetical protein